MEFSISGIRLILGALIGLTVVYKFYHFQTTQSGSLPAVPKVPVEYLSPGNCSSTWAYDPATALAPRKLGGYITSRGVHEVDDHPLSSLLNPQERFLVLGWVFSSPPQCLVERIAAVVGSNTSQLILIHTTLDSSHFSLLMNLMASLRRCQVDTREILLVLYDYEPSPQETISFLDSANIQYISAWEFMLPNELSMGAKLSPPQFFFVRNVLHLKVLKMGYNIVHMDSDIVVLRDHPFKHFDLINYSIEAAPGSSPMPQRRKWGHTLNCGYMSLASNSLTIQFLESFLAYNFDSVDPIDQWAFNEVLYLAGVKFKVHRGWFSRFKPFQQDNTPVDGYLRLDQRALHVRMLNPQEFFAGRWLMHQEQSQLQFWSFIEAMNLSPKTVHVTHVQGGAQAKIESMKMKGLWFLRDDWETKIRSGVFQSLESLVNSTSEHSGF